MGRDSQLWIMIELETSGPIVGTHSMIGLGAAAGSLKHGLIDRFETLIRPVTSAVVAAEAESFARARKEGKSAEEAMKAFEAWCAPFQKHQAIFVARPSAFDWPWIVWYARTYLGKNPFGYRVVCALSWDLAKGKKFDLELPDGALKGAEVLLKHFFKEL